MFTFDPTAYGPIVADLYEPGRLPELGPGRPDSKMRARFESVTIRELFGKHAVRDQSMASCCLAALWLYHDFLDESHEISQTIQTTSGSYWHGIMHRREPDYGNSKYWFRRVGKHPIFEPLRAAAVQIVQSATLDRSAAFLAEQPAWDPFAFVDLCEAAASGRASCELLCRRIQQAEWDLLFDYCYGETR